jgi:hypothetical protein
VPATGHTGDVTISYTAYSMEGTSFTGKVVIDVGDTEPDDISYTTDVDTAVSFIASDFNTVCEEVTGETLSYVYFTLPSTTYGKLYCNYTSATVYDSAVTQTTQYFRSAAPCISNIDFVPTTGYDGDVTISYTAYSIDDSTFTGKIVIAVGEAEEDEDSDHFGDVGRGHKWAVEAIDYLYEQGIITGDGKGYYNPRASISRGDFVLMLCRAFDLDAEDLAATDETTTDATATATHGKGNQGNKNNDKKNFTDVEEGSYYSDAISIAKALNIAKGADGKFNPKASLSRQDAMVLLVRAMDAAGLTIADGDESDLDSFSDSDKISDYAVDAFAALVNAGIIEGSDGKLNPKASVSRAEMATILYRVLTK